MNEKKEQTHKMVEVVYSILESYYNKVINGEIDDAISAKKNVLEQIKVLRYDGDNYFWINDMHPKMIMHPFKTELDGQDLSDFQDPNGKHLFVAFVEEIVREKGEGMVPYLWSKPGEDDPVAKVSYVKLFQPWDWVIGTGIYVDDCGI